MSPPSTWSGRFDPITGFYMFPRWSPDGKWIAYQAGANVEQEIYIVPAGEVSPST